MRETCVLRELATNCTHYVSQIRASELCHGCFGCRESSERNALSHRLLKKNSFQSLLILRFRISIQTSQRGYSLGTVRDIEVSPFHVINVVSPATPHLCSFFFFFLFYSLYSKRLWTLLVCSIGCLF